jgi:hypothetical protein
LSRPASVTPSHYDRNSSRHRTDGHDKQDCEIAASKRWLDKEGPRCLSGLNRNVTRLVNYQLIRATLPTRKTFFDGVRALLRYMCFPSWDATPSGQQAKGMFTSEGGRS